MCRPERQETRMGQVSESRITFKFKIMKKLFINLYKFLNKTDSAKITKSERYIIMTALKLMKNKNTELTMHPSKEKYYIHSEKDGSNSVSMVITKYPQNVTVVNHKFSYDVPFSERAMNILTGRFIETTEQRRDVFERNLLKNTENSLEIIFNSISA